MLDDQVDVEPGLWRMTTTPGTHPTRDGSFNGLGSSATIDPIEIPPKYDPRLVNGARTQRQRLAQLSPAQRAALVLERYPDLRALPSCDWLRLSVQASFSVLFGESARHYAKLELAALAGILASAGVSAAYAKELEIAARRVLELLRLAFGIATPRARSTPPRSTCTRVATANGSAPRIRRRLATCCCRHCRSSSVSDSFLWPSDGWRLNANAKSRRTW